MDGGFTPLIKPSPSVELRGSSVSPTDLFERMTGPIPPPRPASLGSSTISDQENSPSLCRATSISSHPNAADSGKSPACTVDVDAVTTP